MAFRVNERNLRALLGMPAQMLRRRYYDLRRSDMDETSCAYVSSRGIAKACHPLVDLRATGATRIDPAKFRAMEAGAPVYLFTSCIPDFVANYLPQMRRPFTLVTGADDHSVSPGVTGATIISTLLDHPLVTRWFAQNAEIQHAKLTPIPIGMDYHMLAGNHHRPWRTFQSPLDQERELLAVRSVAPAIADKMCTAYANWHFHMGRGDRQECFDSIDRGCVCFEPTMVARTRSWANNARHLFTISPHGNGLDCHRTWEALLLGTIPIVRSSPLDDLYDGLPVCIVDEWGQVDRAFLQGKREEMLAASYVFSKLLQGYWRGLIGLTAPPPSQPVSFQQFLDSGSPGAALSGCSSDGWWRSTS